MKGFMHAIDAVLAGILILTFMSFIFPVPEKYDWNRIHLKEEGFSLLKSLDDSGFLSKMALEGNPFSVKSLITSLTPSRSFLFKVNNLPPKNLEIGYVVDDDKTFISSYSTKEINKNIGLPSSENKIYGTGKIFGVNFTLSDTKFDGIQKFDNVNFDFNNNGFYNDSFEGPYSFNSVFSCTKKFPPYNESCNETLYEIGPLTDSLILLNAERTNYFDRAFKNADFGNFSIYFEFDTINLKYESIRDKDLLLIEGNFNYSPYQNILKVYLYMNKPILYLSNSYTPFHNFLGFEKKTVNPESEDKSFFSSNKSYYPELFFKNMLIEIDNFKEDFRATSHGNTTLIKSGWRIINITGYNFLTGKMKLMNTEFNILIDEDNNKTYLSKDEIFTPLEEIKMGDTFSVENNLYRLESIKPFKISLIGEHKVILKPINVFSKIPLLTFENRRYAGNIPANAVLYSERIFQGNGRAITMGIKDFGDDDINLLRSIALFLTMNERYVISGEPGENSQTIYYSSVLNNKMKIPYIAELVWWYV